MALPHHYRTPSCHHSWTPSLYKYHPITTLQYPLHPPPSSFIFFFFIYTLILFLKAFIWVTPISFLDFSCSLFSKVNQCLSVYLHYIISHSICVWSLYWLEWVRYCRCFWGYDLYIFKQVWLHSMARDTRHPSSRHHRIRAPGG